MAPERAVRRVTWWGFVVNVGLSVFKVAAGLLGNSHAVVADGVHSLTDTVTDVAVIAGSYFWAKPADSMHPYGHKRLETTVSIFIGVVLLVAGIGIGWRALYDFMEGTVSRPGVIALAAAAVSILCKEGLYRWTRMVSERVNSVSLAANAWHHRLDALSSIPVLIAVGVTILHPPWAFLDHVAAVLVAVLVAGAALKIILNGFKELVDQGAPRETCLRIRDIAMADEKVRDVYNIRTRYAGNSLQVDLHVAVDGDLSVHEGHRIADNVKRRIIEAGPHVIDVIVHIEPAEFLGNEDVCL